ncbi:MAG TPA: hypothetical protein VIT92_11025 [Burkholderiaceae bacterium]
MRNLKTCGVVLLVVAMLSPVPQASATIVQVLNRPALGANLTVNWNAFTGPISTPDSAVVGPETVTVSSSQGQLARHTQGVDYFGDFAAGDELLADAGSQSDSFIIRFSNPVAAAGTQIQRHSAMGAFTAYMGFYDTSNVLLNEIMVNGFGTANGSDNAMFIGGVSSAFDISYLLLWVDNDPMAFPARSGDLLINRLDVLVPVPAPGGTAVLVALLGFAALRRRRGRALA